MRKRKIIHYWQSEGGWGKATSPKEMGENRADNNYPLALLLLSVLLGAAVELQVSQGIGRGTFK